MLIQLIKTISHEENFGSRFVQYFESYIPSKIIYYNENNFYEIDIQKNRCSHKGRFYSEVICTLDFSLISVSSGTNRRKSVMLGRGRNYWDEMPVKSFHELLNRKKMLEIVEKTLA